MTSEQLGGGDGPLPATTMAPDREHVYLPIRDVISSQRRSDAPCPAATGALRHVGVTTLEQVAIQRLGEASRERGQAFAAHQP